MLCKYSFVFRHHIRLSKMLWNTTGSFVYPAVFKICMLFKVGLRACYFHHFQHESCQNDANLAELFLAILSWTNNVVIINTWLISISVKMRSWQYCAILGNLILVCCWDSEAYWKWLLAGSEKQTWFLCEKGWACPGLSKLAGDLQGRIWSGCSVLKELLK